MSAGTTHSGAAGIAGWGLRMNLETQIQGCMAPQDANSVPGHLHHPRELVHLSRPWVAIYTTAAKSIVANTATLVVAVAIAFVLLAV